MPLQQLSAEDIEYLLTLEHPPEDVFAPSDSPLLRLLSSVDRALLNNVLTEHHYARGEVLFREGERGDAMYLIRAGRVIVLKGPIASPIVLGYRGPGEVIGEMALLEGQPRSATNIAVEDLRVLRTGRDEFQRLVSIKPEIGMSIMSTLSARLRVADNIRTSALEGGKQLVRQVTRLQTEKEQLLELQRVRQETSDLIVHDLRNPLGIIYGALNMLEMVLPEAALADNRELLDLANTACERMQRLVDSLLDVAKLETGEMPLTLTHTDLVPLLRNAARRQSINAQTRNITISTEYPDTLPTVLVDQEMIDRVVVNLLDNALKYTPNNNEIAVSVHEGERYIVISVTDAGPGIPPEERERIFERFAQIADGISKRRGFGLGLTFCYLAIEAHGGEIWVEPGPNGNGSCFSFTIPLQNI